AVPLSGWTPAVAPAASSGSVQTASASAVREVAKQHKLGSAITVVVLLALVAAAAFGIYSFLARKKAAGFEHFTVTPVTETGKASLAAISPDGNYILNVQRE